MPKERESELRQLEGKAFNHVYSSCVKKLTTNRQKEVSQFDVLADLSKLSDKGDQIAETKLPKDSGLTEWFDAVKQTMINIRDCKNIKDIEYPPSITTFLSLKDKDEKIIPPATDATPILKIATSTNKVTSVKMAVSSTTKNMTPVSKITPPNKTDTSDAQMVTPATSVRKKVNPFVFLHQLSNEEIAAHSNEKSLKHNPKILSEISTCTLNRTYEKINTTVVLDSGSAKDKNQTSSTSITSSGDSGIKMKSNLQKTKENDCPNSHGMVTRSGSKRKSSGTRNKSSKKQKVDIKNVSSATLNKATRSRHPLRDLQSSLASANKNKLSAVVKPTPKPPVVSKEQQMLEELQKKEKKRQENMQKIMAERQLKAEQNKKAREEKRTKTQQKRLQLEKEKEEKREMEAKQAKQSQVKVNNENPKKTTRTKELVEQHSKKNKSSLITSTTQGTNNTEVVVKTPVKRQSEEVECYELTPVPESSSYNFSDDDDEEEERSRNKKIPLWAQGVHLKSALMQQYYYPVNTDELFGSYIESPNLVAIFKINKKVYNKRTSSAVWNMTPNQSYNF